MIYFEGKKLNWPGKAGNNFGTEHPFKKVELVAA